MSNALVSVYDDVIILDSDDDEDLGPNNAAIALRPHPDRVPTCDIVSLDGSHDSSSSESDHRGDNDEDDQAPVLNVLPRRYSPVPIDDDHRNHQAAIPGEIHGDDLLAFWDNIQGNFHPEDPLDGPGAIAMPANPRPSSHPYIAPDSNGRAFNIDFGSNGAKQEPWRKPAVTYELIEARLTEVFPNICPDFLRLKFEKQTKIDGGHSGIRTLEEVSQSIINEVLETSKYPKRKEVKIGKKRKHGEIEDPEILEQNEYASRERPRIWDGSKTQNIRNILLAEFSLVPVTFIDQCLQSRNQHLYPTYLEIDEALKTYETGEPRFTKLKRARGMRPLKGHQDRDLWKELQCARRKIELDQALKQKAAQEEAADAELDRKAHEEGNVVECQCCFADTPTAKTTHCTNDPCHFFCLDCAKGAAKAQIELQRYRLPCMDGSGCQMEFSRSERLRFLDPSMLSIVERLQQQDELRKAKIEGLEECPRCSYAEIYPSVEENRVFECKNDDCEAVAICRICKSDSHLPKSCEEYQKDLGLTERNVVAEAMTEALIRKCPKCSVAIIKEDGCNKMTCSKCGCYFCDVCKKDITKEKYAHFSTTGPCKQSDNFKTRDSKRVNEAAREAKAKILAEHSDLKEEDLTIKFSEQVTQDSGAQRNREADGEEAIARIYMRRARNGARARLRRDLERERRERERIRQNPQVENVEQVPHHPEGRRNAVQYPQAIMPPRPPVPFFFPPNLPPTTAMLPPPPMPLQVLPQYGQPQFQHQHPLPHPHVFHNQERFPTQTYDINTQWGILPPLDPQAFGLNDTQEMFLGHMNNGFVHFPAVPDIGVQTPGPNPFDFMPQPIQNDQIFENHVHQPRFDEVDFGQN